MSDKQTLRLGTRRSALAWVQSSQVAAALRAAHPGLEIEMVGIETRGDRIIDVKHRLPAIWLNSNVHALLSSGNIVKHIADDQQLYKVGIVHRDTLILVLPSTLIGLHGGVEDVKVEGQPRMTTFIPQARKRKDYHLL